MKSNQFQNQINSKIRHSSRFDHISTLESTDFSKTPKIDDFSHKMHTLRDTCNQNACRIIWNAFRMIRNVFRMIRNAYSIRFRSSMQLIPTWNFRNTCYTLKKIQNSFFLQNLLQNQSKIQTKSMEHPKHPNSKIQTESMKYSKFN